MQTRFWKVDAGLLQTARGFPQRKKQGFTKPDSLFLCFHRHFPKKLSNLGTKAYGEPIVSVVGIAVCRLFVQRIKGRKRLSGSKNAGESPAMNSVSNQSKSTVIAYHHGTPNPRSKSKKTRLAKRQEAASGSKNHRTPCFLCKNAHLKESATIFRGTC